MSARDRREIREAIEARGMFSLVAWLLWIGFVRLNTNGSLRWPVRVDPWPCWRVALRGGHGARVGLFRNLPGVVRDVGTWLPRRWGFYILGFEFGQRG